ncbi:UNVERIFIED_CONTAM: hypothetical protein K2H54_051676 [Gekko kuhli]
MVLQPTAASDLDRQCLETEQYDIIPGFNLEMISRHRGTGDFPIAFSLQPFKRKEESGACSNLMIGDLASL